MVKTQTHLSVGGPNNKLNVSWDADLAVVTKVHLLRTFFFFF